MVYYIECDENNEVIFMHRLPFDEALGLGKTQQELETTGFLVEKNAYSPEDVPGKIRMDYFDPSTKTFYFEYVDVPLAVEDELIQMKADYGIMLFESATDKAKIASLEATTGDLIMEVATLKMGGIA